MSSNEDRSAISEANGRIMDASTTVKTNVSVTAGPEGTEHVGDESLTPAQRIWVESLGPDGIPQLVKAGELFMNMGAILHDAADASQSHNLPKLEDLERDARVLKAQANHSPFPWVHDFISGGQLAVSSMAHTRRGIRFMGAWRHNRARDEIDIASTQLEEALKLMDHASIGVPSCFGFDEVKKNLDIDNNVWRQSMALITASAKQADLEKQLLLGRVDVYVQGVRTLAQELTSASEGVLNSGSDNPFLRGFSRELADGAETLRDRVDAIEELQQGQVRNIYLPPLGNKVFLIHGHAEDEWHDLRSLLEEHLQLKDRVVVLKEEASQSKTVIDKFEAFANQCIYAVALVTPDDIVTNEEAKYTQARPNVLFEIGWFYGRFGPRRLLIVQRKGTVLPSDLGGVVTCEFSGAVKESVIDIERELRAAGVIA